MASSKYLLRRDLAEELHDWVYFSGSSDKNYGFNKVSDGKDSYYEVPFICDYIKGFIMVDTPNSISVVARRSDGVGINKRFRDAYSAKVFLTNNCMIN
jgi:hypothetical protein